MDRQTIARIKGSIVGGNQIGFNLLEVMVATGLLAAMSFAIAVTSQQVAIRMAKSGALTKVDIAQSNVASLVMKSGSWQAALKGTLNGSLKTCLESMATTPLCRVPSWCSSRYIAKACTRRKIMRRQVHSFKVKELAGQ